MLKSRRNCTNQQHQGEKCSYSLEHLDQHVEYQWGNVAEVYMLEHSVTPELVEEQFIMVQKIK